MRKIYFLLSIVLFSGKIINAQIDKGQKLLMGNIGISINKNEIDTQSTQKQFYLLVSPVFGKAIKKNLVLGFRLSGGYSNIRNGSSQLKTKENQWISGGGVFLRKYFPLGKGFSFSADLGAGFFHADHKAEFNNLISATT